MRAMTLLFALLVLCAITAGASIPYQIHYQGHLTDEVGNAVADGDYEFVFAIYDTDTGGTALWSESQTLTVENNIVNATLGSVTPLGSLAFDVTYWLGMAIEGEEELTPRTPLTSAPYALRAETATTCIEGDSDWTMDGDDVYRDSGHVGIGTSSPSYPLHVRGGSGMTGWFSNNGFGPSDFTLTVINENTTAGAFYSGHLPLSWPIDPVAVYGYGGPNNRGAYFGSVHNDGVAAVSDSGRGIWARSDHGYAGYFDGSGLGVFIEDQLETGAFKMATGAVAGHVLTADASGVGSWASPIALGDSDWDVDGDNMHAIPTGLVGVGTDVPLAKIDVEYAGAHEALAIEHSGYPGRVCKIARTSTPSSANDMLEINAPSGSPDGFQFIECERGGDVEFQVFGWGQVMAEGGADFRDFVSVTDGSLNVYNDGGDCAANFTTTIANGGAAVVSSQCPDTGSHVDGYAVRGTYVQSADYGIGGRFDGGYKGVEGRVEGAGAAMSRVGVYGSARNSTSGNYGLYGYAMAGTGGSSYGVFAGAPTGTSSWAGYFAGDVHISGTLTGGSMMSKVDHPLDPENSYLLHAAVESDELTNVYSGNAVLDGEGRARVDLPDWFEAVNTDFRYQLTAIGAPGPNLFVARKISGNSFEIAGGDPGMEVSWQVTAVRNDPHGRAHRLVAEQDKEVKDAGKYVHPGLYGRPETAAIGYADLREVEPDRAPVVKPVNEPFDPTDGQ
jgi:hypothetical protein